jgi:4-hydroxy-3-methylbut-2-enyl diphosphate reductase
MPNRSDLCFATTNRQAALKAIAGRSDAVVVIGSVNSSNTRALEKVAAAVCPRVLRVNQADELPDDLSGTVGVTAGASAPDELVDAVVARLSPRLGVEEVHVTDEDEYFPPPPELRDLLRGLGAALSLGLGAPVGAADVAGSEEAGASGDRFVSASDVLAALAG